MERRMEGDKRWFFRTLTAYSFSSVLSHLWASRTTEVAPLPIAIFWQTPYFCARLAVLSPATDLRSPSESDFLLLPVDLAEDLRLIFGAEEIRSLRVNFWPPSEWEFEGALGRKLGWGEGEGLAVGGAKCGSRGSGLGPAATLGGRLWA